MGSIIVFVTGDLCSALHSPTGVCLLTSTLAKEMIEMSGLNLPSAYYHKYLAEAMTDLN